MGIARTSTTLTLTTMLLIASCVRHQVALEESMKSDATIVFHNQAHDRIQVYLIDERQERLLGRLEPLETARLRLPNFSSERAEAVLLAVIPGWSKDLRPSRNGRAIFSIKEFTNNLPGEEWIFVSGQLIGASRTAP